MNPPLVLLGAGASQPAGVPVATEMTLMMAEKLPSRAQRAFTFIVGGLQQVARHGERALPAIDVEQVMSAARLLGNRSDAALFPFVGTWHPMVEMLDRELLAEISAAAIRRSASPANPFSLSLSYLAGAGNYLPGNPIYPTGNFADVAGIVMGSDGERAAQLVKEHLGAVIETWARQLLLQPDGAIFRELSSQLTSLLMSFAFVTDTAKVEYLAPLVERARAAPLTVVTLNYDNSIELCAQQHEVRCNDGLSHWREHAILPPAPEKGIELLKLHGSINWLWDVVYPRPVSRRALTTTKLNETVVANLRAEPLLGEQLGVIFGGGNKLTAEGPFLDLLARFKAALRQHEHLLVIGYSFRDDHVNQCILGWLQSSQAKRLTVVIKPGTTPDGHPLLTIAGDKDSRLHFDACGAEGGIKAYL
jgi:hypothetical protein